MAMPVFTVTLRRHYHSNVCLHTQQLSSLRRHGINTGIFSLNSYYLSVFGTAATISHQQLYLQLSVQSLFKIEKERTEEE